MESHSRGFISFPPISLKMDVIPIPDLDDPCGICLAECSIRSRIDGCDHQFCFVCIMEWAKVESRCPLCRTRFGSVTRPVTPCLFQSERVFNISERNQVYNFLGEAAINEPFPKTNCTICNSNKSEDYLLLCNLCQSFSHTFCTDLGYTVPNKNWYCPDCTVCQAEYSKYQSEETLNCKNGETLERLIAVRNGEYSSVNNIYDFVDGTEGLVPIAEVALGSGTSHTRLVQNRLRFIRNNWELMRIGSMEFSAGFVNPNTEKKMKNKKRVNNGEESRKKAWRNLEKVKPLIKKNNSVNNFVQRKQERFYSEQLRNGGSSSSSFGNASRNKFAPMVKNNNNNTNYNNNNNYYYNNDNNYYNNNNGVVVEKLERREDMAIDKAKSEIQLMVKQNMKILANKLGIDRFKELARVSTHSILAACGFEHSKSVARNFSKSPCKHSGEIKSNLMKNYCQNCFNSFVYEVVKSVLSE